jgi:hypothetical protein
VRLSVFLSPRLIRGFNSMTYYLTARSAPKSAGMKTWGLQRRRAVFDEEKTEKVFSNVSYYVIVSDSGERVRASDIWRLRLKMNRWHDSRRRRDRLGLESYTLSLFCNIRQGKDLSILLPFACYRKPETWRHLADRRADRRERECVRLRS